MLQCLSTRASEPGWKSGFRRLQSSSYFWKLPAGRDLLLKASDADLPFPFSRGAACLLFCSWLKDPLMTRSGRRWIQGPASYLRHYMAKAF